MNKTLLIALFFSKERTKGATEFLPIIHELEDLWYTKYKAMLGRGAEQRYAEIKCNEEVVNKIMSL